MQSDKQPSYWAAGWATFAGLMLILLGLFHAIAGLAEVVDPDAYVTTENYVYRLSSDAWGWIHLIVGLVVMFSGIGLFSGNVLARTIGVIAVAVSMMSNFFFIPAYPIWALIVITIDVLVIWALTAHGGEMRQS